MSGDRPDAVSGTSCAARLRATRSGSSSISASRTCWPTDRGPSRELAQDAGADPDTLNRLLRALASDGVFEDSHRDVSPTPGLRAAHRRRAGATSRPVRRRLLPGVGGPGRATGGCADFPRRFGTDFWPWLAEHPEERAAFDRAMATGSEPAREQLAALEWRGRRVVVDVGGGNGALLADLLRRSRACADRPGPAGDGARRGGARRARSPSSRAASSNRSPTGDVYIVSEILHDWGDAQATAILRTIRAAAPATPVC